MRIIHLSTYDCVGGAAVAAFRLNSSLNSIGFDSKMFVREKTKISSSVIRYNPRNNSMIVKLGYNYRKKHIQKSFTQYKEIPENLEMFSSPLSPLATGPISQIPEADIYHLHWITNFLDIPELFKELAKRGKPVVWTLHDMNPFTGGCHHDDDCGKFKQICGTCPQLGSDHNKDLSFRQLKIKKEAYSLIPPSKMYIATDSNWLRDCAKQSNLLMNYDIETVHYGLDTEIFKPFDKRAARNVLNIHDNQTVISFGAANLSNARKGFHYLVNALNRIGNEYGNILLLTYGDGFPDYKINFPVKHLGPVINPSMVAIIQNAADFFVIPSMREAFGQTCLEAMSCGIPAVGFNGGGIPDMIKDGFTGYLAIERDEPSLAEALKKMINDDAKRLEMGKNARQFVLENFTLDLQAEKYSDIYSHLLLT
jgi:glycosyltransferase involved in cell wall biosynthesis